MSRCICVRLYLHFRTREAFKRILLSKPTVHDHMPAWKLELGERLSRNRASNTDQARGRPRLPRLAALGRVAPRHRPAVPRRSDVVVGAAASRSVGEHLSRTAVHRRSDVAVGAADSNSVDEHLSRTVVHSRSFLPEHC